MKKTVIGGFITLAGSVWALVILSFASNNIADHWHTNYGKLWSVVLDFRLVFPFVLSVIVTVLGLALLLVEYFRKEEQVPVQIVADERPWICSKCGASNPKSKVQCHSCGTMRP